MKDVSILINSCQKFSDMWENILFLYDKHWPNHPSLRIVSDGLDDCIDPRLVMCYEGDMSDRLLKAIQDIDTKYIFLSFDDYYPSRAIDISRMDAIVDLMEQERLGYCRLFDEPKTKGKKIGNLKYRYLPLIKNYEVNFYPSFWRKDALVQLIKEKETIWKAEARITRRMRELGLKGISIDDPTIFPFVDIVRKGKYLRSAYRFLKKNNLYISNREVRTIKETLRLNLQIFVSNHAPKIIKERIKNHLRKKGQVFYSDYADTEG